MDQDQRIITEQFLYCSFCGGFLEYGGNNLLHCQSCLRHLYINPRPVNGAILENDKGEIMLVKRKADPSIGKWDLPGGFVDLNETVEQSLKRELKEEIGITPFDLRYFDSYSDIYVYQGISYPTIGFIYTGKIKSDQKLTVSSDIDGFEFFSQEKIPFENLAFPSLGIALKKILNN
jgi:mutator protein MutT